MLTFTWPQTHVRFNGAICNNLLKVRVIWFKLQSFLHQDFKVLKKKKQHVCFLCQSLSCISIQGEQVWLENILRCGATSCLRKTQHTQRQQACTDSWQYGTHTLFDLSWVEGNCHRGDYSFKNLFKSKHPETSIIRWVILNKKPLHFITNHCPNWHS